MSIIIKADCGKIWKSKKEGWTGSNVLILGRNDSIENYEQVDEPIDENLSGAVDSEEKIIEEV